MRAAIAKQRPEVLSRRFLPDSTLIDVNDTYCETFGRHRDTLIGTKFLDFIPKKNRASAAKHLLSLVANPRGVIFEHEVLLPNHSGWQQWVDYPVYDNRGNLIEFKSVGRPIPNPSPVEHHPLEMVETICPCEDRILARHGIRVVLSCNHDEIRLLTYDVHHRGWLIFGHQSINTAIGIEIPNADFYFRGIGFLEDAFNSYCELTLADSPTIWREIYRKIGAAFSGHKCILEL